jgi:hypothetical protein
MHATLGSYLHLHRFRPWEIQPAMLVSHMQRRAAEESGREGVVMCDWERHLTCREQ